MARMTRREFVKVGAALAAAGGLSTRFGRIFAAGLENLASRRLNVLWIQGQSCSGCSVSLLNADNPYALEVVTELISLVFHQTISAAQGDVVPAILEKVKTVPYVLVVEGSIPMNMPDACVIGEHRLTDLLVPLIGKARLVVAAGSCAAYGGIPSGEGNETGAASVREFMDARGLRAREVLINCPSCPVHPDTLVGTLAYAAAKGYPPVHPDLLTPNMYYAHSTHDDCPRFHYYSKQIFAERFGDKEGCLFKLGCLGMLSFTECPRRQWNGGVNWCVRAGAPCIGCSHPLFAKKKSFPFYRKSESIQELAFAESNRGEVDRKGTAR
ncbi:MAG: hydrogenase small subunit [Planctomycetes bacterium]|nr:hydrogenase small subunit [Planctomycetota bacterium]